MSKRRTEGEIRNDGNTNIDIGNGRKRMADRGGNIDIIDEMGIANADLGRKVRMIDGRERRIANGTLIGCVTGIGIVIRRDVKGIEIAIMIRIDVTENGIGTAMTKGRGAVVVNGIENANQDTTAASAVIATTAHDENTEKGEIEIIESILRM